MRLKHRATNVQILRDDNGNLLPPIGVLPQAELQSMVDEGFLSAP